MASVREAFEDVNFVGSVRQDQGMLRQAGARTKDALVDVLGEALSAISAQDARGYFEHAGYRLQAQLL